jgi:tripartite-type tricarboxylate transporter receptor subunit TctC
MLRLISAFAAGAAALAIAASAHAQTPEEFYKGTTVSLVVPFNPGGTTANVAEVVAESIGKYIPGHPKVITQYMPGAGGVTAENYVYSVAPKDGSVLFVPQDSIVAAQLLAPEGVKYDAGKFHWLGVIVPTRSILMVRKDSGVTSVDDLKNKEIFVGSSGAGSETDMYPRVANGLLGTKMKVIPGYPGGAPQVLVALEGGEVQGSVQSWTAWQRRPDLLDKLTPLMTFGSGREPGLPDVPNLLELVSSPDDQQIVKLVSSIGPIGRGVATPPDVPADRVDALRAAFDQMVKDEDFLAKMKGLNLPVTEPISGVEAQKIVESSLAGSPDVVKRTLDIIAIPPG